jgi:hypothetical protein
VLPLAREVMHTSNDIPMDVYELQQRYGEGQPDAQGLKFDFSIINAVTIDP